MRECKFVRVYKNGVYFNKCLNCKDLLPYNSFDTGKNVEVINKHKSDCKRLVKLVNGKKKYFCEVHGPS